MSQKNLVHEKNKIISLFNQKKFDKISKISSKILDQFNEQIEIVKILFIFYINQKNYFKAEQYLKNSLSKLNSAELNYFLGNTLKIQDKNLEAINAYKKSISLNSDYSEAYNNLANVQKKIGMLDSGTSPVKIFAVSEAEAANYFKNNEKSIFSFSLFEKIVNRDKRNITLQVGAFSNPDSANTLKERIERLGVKNIFIKKVRSKRKIYYRVRVGPVKTPREYEDAIRKLSSLSLDINLISD